MTQMGLDYLKYKETKRSNLANEAETNRSNVAREHETNRHNLVTEEETHRSNVAREVETNRSNLANEAETHRSNVARETETHRSNVAKELETNRSNLAKEAENIRSNVARETETHRANVAKETQAALDSERDYETGMISAFGRYPNAVKYTVAALYGTGRLVSTVTNQKFNAGVVNFMADVEDIFGQKKVRELQRIAKSKEPITAARAAQMAQEIESAQKSLNRSKQQEFDRAIKRFESSLK